MLVKEMFYNEKKIIILFFFLLINPANASNEKIINNLTKINNLSFNFEQKINNKIENGNCVIQYPKKIFCSYKNFNKKILISNGKSLVIKNQTNNQYYIYPLKKTPLDLILDKDYLIKQIKNLKGRTIDNKYLNYTLENNNQIINIFFDIKNYNLLGWQTEDIYQNLVITFISLIKINEKIDEKIFQLPKKN